MTLLVFDKLTKEYQGIKALDNVSFAINPKEFVFIVGPSGAGKSTLLKMLIHEDIPTSGTIYFENKNIFEISHKDLPELRRKIGVVFQDFEVLNSKTVFDNVAVALEVVDTPMHVIKEVVPNVLSLVGLLDKVNSYPTMLSGGEKQRLAIARALAHEPEVIVADEPTGMIDPLGM
jgi:cell division transport system ATP-binding protein